MNDFTKEAYSALPEEVKQAGLFCLWNYEDRGGAKKTKVPYDPVTRQRAKSNDPATFADFSTAISVKGYSGIGIGIFNGISAIDLDDCITDSGFYTQNALDIVDLMHSYTEVSPSGKGLRILFRADGFVYDKQRYYVVNHKQGLEVYIAGATQRYVTVTGNRVNDYPFGERGAELQQVLERYMRQPEKPKNSGINGLNGFFGKMDYFPKMLSDEELLQKAMSSRMGAEFQRLWNGDITGYKSQSEADMALCSSLAFWTGRNEEQMDRLFRKSGLMRKKWDRSQSGSTYGAITIRKAVERCRSIYQITEKKVMTPSQEETENPVENVKNTTPDVQAAMSKGFQPFVKLEPQKNHLPPFPIDALPAPLRDCVKAVSLNSQTSPDMAAVIGLGCLAVCLQGKYQVEAGSGYCEPLSLYTVVIASPGERKSSVLNRMTKPIYDFEIAYNKAREPERMENQRMSLQLCRS